VYFPRLVLPLSAVVSPLLDFAIGFIFLVVMMIYYHVHLTAGVLLLPLFLALAVLTALGVGLWLSAMNAIYRDVRYVVPFLVQFWMFASPVAYPSSLIPARYRWLYGLNPMAGVIEGFRWSLTGHGHPPGALLIASSAAVLVLVLTGTIYFQKMEGVVADVV
jgi:lipopolysaccharide transport system permease protein